MTTDPVAVFYDGGDRLPLGRHPHVRIPLAVVAIAVAGTALVAFVAADVSVLENAAATVRVTAVDWYAGGVLIGSQAGFSLHVASVFVLPLACTGLCFKYDAASVSAPFEVVGFSAVYTPAEFVNTTVRAPSTSFVGSLAITLTIG